MKVVYPGFRHKGGVRTRAAVNVMRGYLKCKLLHRNDTIAIPRHARATSKNGRQLRSTRNVVLTMYGEKSFISQVLSSALMIRPVFLIVSPLLLACSSALSQDKTTLNRGGYGSVMTPEQVARELGPETGILPGDQAYEGKPVKSVSVRYRSSGKTVSEDRLKNLLATQPGTKYSPDVVNKDLERLLESGLVGGNTTVAVEPSGEGVSVVFEMAAQNLLGGVGFQGNTAFDSQDLSEECGLKGGEALSDKALSSAITKLRTYYQESRYPDVQVSYFTRRRNAPALWMWSSTSMKAKRPTLSTLISWATIMSAPRTCVR